MKRIIWFVVIVAIIALLVVAVRKNNTKSVTGENVNKDSQVASSGENVKEFSMTSFTEVKDGKYYPQYSLKEINVKKGDKVRIKITVTSGMHDFKIDEYGVYADTQLNKETVVEFTADKVGDFVYYCTKPGHRENGHWGTLRVTE